MSKEQKQELIKKLDEIIKNDGGYLKFFELSKEIDEMIKNIDLKSY